MLAAVKFLEGSVRRANAADQSALQRLIGDAPPACHALVFDIAGTVVAAMKVVCDGTLAHVQALVVDPGFEELAQPIEERMLGVATALCEAYGCQPSTSVQLLRRAPCAEPDPRFAVASERDRGRAP
jgi:hypothetical protein